MTRNDLVKEIIRILFRLVDALRADDDMLDTDLAQIQYDLLQLTIDGNGNKPIIESPKNE